MQSKLRTESSVPSNYRATVVLADDHPAILNRVSSILREEFEIVSSVGDGKTLIEVTELFRPDVVVLDIAMPELNGIHAAREIRRLGIPSRIIFLTVQEDADYIQVATEIGASYVLKARMHTDLLPAIREALDGRLITPAANHI